MDVEWQQYSPALHDSRGEEWEHVAYCLWLAGLWEVNCLSKNIMAIMRSLSGFSLFVVCRRCRPRDGRGREEAAVSTSSQEPRNFKWFLLPGLSSIWISSAVGD